MDCLNLGSSSFSSSFSFLLFVLLFLLLALLLLALLLLMMMMMMTSQPCSMEEGEESQVLARPDPRLQATLDSELEVDPMEDEQTWPTPEELQDAEGRLGSTAPVLLL